MFIADTKKPIVVTLLAFSTKQCQLELITDIKINGSR